MNKTNFSFFICEFFTNMMMYLFLQKIDYTSLNEDTLFINKSTSNCTIKSDFEKIFAVEAVKYPFLPKSQIKNRIMTIMKKKNISLPRYVSIAVWKI